MSTTRGEDNVNQRSQQRVRLTLADDSTCNQQWHTVSLTILIQTVCWNAWVQSGHQSHLTSRTRTNDKSSHCKIVDRNRRWLVKVPRSTNSSVHITISRGKSAVHCASVLNASSILFTTIHPSGLYLPVSPKYWSSPYA